MWCSYHKATTHNDAGCRATLANGLKSNAHFAQIYLPSVPEICGSWDLPVRDDSDEKPCISLLAREFQPAGKPAKGRVEEKKGTRPFGPVQTAATEGWKTRSRSFTPRVDPQPVTKPAKARVEKKGARPFGPVSTEATEGWRTHPWPCTPRAAQAISIGGPVAEATFGMANDEEPVRKLSWLRRRSPLHPRTAPTVTLPPVWHQRNLFPVRYGNLYQGKHQRLCQGAHQRRVE